MMKELAIPPFDVLTFPLPDVAVHNARLVGVRPAPDGFEVLTVECAGAKAELAGGGRWNDELSGRDVDRIGYLVPARPVWGVRLPRGACYFRPYPDRSLRRAPELDGPDPEAAAAGRNPNVVGWRCDAVPGGFRAPAGLVPGDGGVFMPDQTVAVTLRIPPEFVEQCRQVRLTAEEVLQGFVGDLAGIQNYVNCPRADGYGSNGSDERAYAENWLDRAHGMRRVDPAELDAQDEEAEQLAADREELVGLMDEYVANGGTVEDFLDAVQALLDRQPPAT